MSKVALQYLPISELHAENEGFTFAVALRRYVPNTEKLHGRDTAVPVLSRPRRGVSELTLLA